MKNSDIFNATSTERRYNCGIVEKERNGEKVICSIALESINNLVDDVRDVSGDVC